MKKEGGVLRRVIGSRRVKMSKFCFEHIYFGWPVEHRVENTSRYLKPYVEMGHFRYLDHAPWGRRLLFILTCPPCLTNFQNG